MLDHTDKHAPEFDLPATERLYRNYFATCRHLGIELVQRHRAQELMAEWSEAIAAGRSVPPTAH